MEVHTASPTPAKATPTKANPTQQQDQQQHDVEDEKKVSSPVMMMDGGAASPTLVSTYEEMNPSRRCSMEDCCVYAPPGTWEAPMDDMAYLGVYDGHGGRDMVEYLEHGLTYHVAQELACPDSVDMATRLERAFLMADIHSKQLGITTSGATVAICLIQKPRHSNRLTLYTANAGDARIVLGHEGFATRLTYDHRTDDPAEVQRIQQAGGFLFKGRVLGVLAVTRSLGDHCMKQYVIAKPHCEQRCIEISSSSPSLSSSTRDNNNEKNDRGSFVILACDGLWDVFQDQDAVDFCYQYKDSDPENAANYLVHEALRRGSNDNITVVVAWL